MKTILRFLLLISFCFIGNGAEIATITETAQVYGTTILIYGGADHDIYLGKLNASRYDAESIWNPYGTYGSRYSSKSIWNAYGTYGSMYSDLSPFNSFATNPPVLVDASGNFYGYFTANRYKSKRADSPLINAIIKHHDDIRNDVGEWYDLFFR